MIERSLEEIAAMWALANAATLEAMPAELELRPEPTEGDYWNWKDDLLQEIIALDGLDACSASGSCDDACEDVAEYLPARIIASMPEKHIRRELEECGAWDAVELSDNDANLVRLIRQVACEESERRHGAARALESAWIRAGEAMRAKYPERFGQWGPR